MTTATEIPVRGLTKALSVITGPGRKAGRGDLVALAGFILLALAAVLAPVLAPYDPTLPAGDAFLSPGSAGHLLGTDALGYDILSRLLYGLRASLLAAAIIIASGVIVGGGIGLLAGAIGGWVDNLLMRVTDLFLALPGMVIAMAVSAALGAGFWTALLGVALVWWPMYARLVRGEVKAWAARPHMEAARLAGISAPRRVLRHLLPGVTSTIVVTASLDVGGLVVAMAGLSFIGLSSPAPAPELGAMAAQGMQYLLQFWWIPVMPGLAVLLLALLAGLAGDAIRDLIARR